MLETLSLISQDWNRYFLTKPGHNKLLIFPVLFFYHPGMIFSLIFRIEHYLYTHKNPLLKLLAFFLYPLYFFISYYVLNFSIHARNKIGGGMLIHNSDIIISDETIIGKNITLIGPITVGNNFSANASPKIGDNIIISTGARILGNVKIGNGSIVGANAVVVKDVPEDVIVGGIPAKILKKREDAKLLRKWDTTKKA